MTTVAAITDGKKVFMAYDSGLSIGDDFIGQSVQSKVFTVEDLLFGYYGSTRAGNIIRYSLRIPSKIEDVDAHEWVSKYVVTAIQDAFLANNYTIDDEVGFGCLVAHGGRIFLINTDFAVTEWERGYAAVGSGEKYALGALYAHLPLIKSGVIDHSIAVRDAVGAAVEFDPYSIAPVGFAST